MQSVAFRRKIRQNKSLTKKVPKPVQIRFELKKLPPTKPRTLTSDTSRLRKFSWAAKKNSNVRSTMITRGVGEAEHAFCLMEKKQTPKYAESNFRHGNYTGGETTNPRVFTWCRTALSLSEYLAKNNSWTKNRVGTYWNSIEQFWTAWSIRMFHHLNIGHNVLAYSGSLRSFVAGGWRSSQIWPLSYPFAPTTLQAGCNNNLSFSVTKLVFINTLDAQSSDLDFGLSLVTLMWRSIKLCSIVCLLHKGSSYLKPVKFYV